MRPIQTYSIAPSLPEELKRLLDLAYNMSWAWDYEAVALFRRLDPDLWEQTEHNPILMLGTISQDRLAAAAANAGFLAQLDRVSESHQRYLSEEAWYGRKYGTDDGLSVAYFSAEFGITESLRIYSGGLGILSGDHLKSASDLGLPLIGVGLLYQQGYFRQYLNAAGWQQERYPDNDFHTLPLRQEKRPDGSRVSISVPFPHGPVHADVWRAQVGRVPLLLLDTNVPGNARQEDRDITDQLYGGDLDTRIRQEIMLGIGGLRALDAAGLRPTVCHLNEGHSAFLALERIRRAMVEENLTFTEAREATRVGNVFTTHTPVPAGNDLFPPELVDRYFSHYYPQLGLSRHEFMSLGRQDPSNEREGFCMTVLALRLCTHRNGVSKLHGRVSRKMWRAVWPHADPDEIPIEWITNGVHGRSWISHDLVDLYDRYLGPEWREDPTDQTVWEHLQEIPDEELWRTHERRRERLVAFARRRMRRQLEQRGASASERQMAQDVLNPYALTIGFARRFATYKRATLILHDLDRLTRILLDRQRPVQLILAGKAHPKDNPGKDFIRQIVQFARREDLRRHIVFLEDYDITMARYLVQGVDVWLNTPRRLLEASGTSGMKATANGAINMSVLDGWWDEAYAMDPNVGWAIGQGELYDDHTYQDSVESAAIYEMLEKEVAPLFYGRGQDGLPHGWIARMRQAMRAACPYFNTARMVSEYAERFYRPAHQCYTRLAADNRAQARALAAWQDKVASQWGRVRVETVDVASLADLTVGAKLHVRAQVAMGGLVPQDVRVEVCYGPVDSEGQVCQARTVVMSHAGPGSGPGTHRFAGEVPLDAAGRHGLGVRILPDHEALCDPYPPGLICWADVQPVSKAP